MTGTPQSEAAGGGRLLVSGTSSSRHAALAGVRGRSALEASPRIPEGVVVAKVKSMRGRGGYVFFKELGGAPDRKALSKTARVLIDGDLIRGRVLDYGCGLGFDADQQGWEAYDPYYRPGKPTGPYHTIVVNHVANILTRASRAELFHAVNVLLAPGATAFISVARNIPASGKAGPRRRIQNYVVLTLPWIFADEEEEIYVLAKDAVFEDRTREFEETA